MQVTKYKYTDIWPTNYAFGMWVWLAHRISGIVLAVYGLAHLVVISYVTFGSDGKSFNDIMKFFDKPYLLAFEVALMAVAFFHVLNGFRIILFDLGIGIRVQKQIFIALMVVGAVLFSIAVWALLPAFS
jgi:succinate dehydrogenase / fumarate reductase cytochrome b subunit